MNSFPVYLFIASIGFVFLWPLFLCCRRFLKTDPISRYRLGKSVVFLAVISLPMVWLTVKTGWNQNVFATRTALTEPNPKTSVEPIGSTIALARQSQFATKQGNSSSNPSLSHSSGYLSKPLRFTTNRFIKDRFDRWRQASLFDWIGFVYVAGLACMGLRFIGCFWNTRKLWRGCRPCENAEANDLLEEVLGSSGLTDVQLLVSESLRVPASIRWPKRSIILPAKFLDRFDKTQLRCILQHEHIHLARGDWRSSIAEELLRVCYWFHPAAWHICRVVSEDRETSCDCEVIRKIGQKHSYAHTLLSLHQSSFLDRSQRTAFLHSFLHKHRNLHRRLEMLATSNSSSWIARYGVASFFVVGCLLFGTAQVQLAAEFGLNEQDAAATKNEAEVSKEGMSVEIKAREEGRGPSAMYKHLAPLYEKFGGVTFITNQETILNFDEGTIDGDQIKSREIYLNLPEGSKMRAVLSGLSINVDPSGDATKITAQRGQLVVYGPNDVVRFKTSDSTQPLLIEVWIKEEIEIRVRTADNQSRVIMTSDLKTGIPAQEEQPPHNAVRYQQISPDANSDNPHRIKMQWIYQMAQLKQDAAAETKEMMDAIQLQQFSR